MCLGIPGRIIEMNDGEGVTSAGKVDFGGILKEVSLAFVPEARVEIGRASCRERV